MANDNKPIWKDYPLYCGNGDYVIEELVNGTWQTRKRFHVLRTPYGGGEVAANDMLCADLKTDYPETTGVTTHSAAYRRYRCQTGSTASQTQVFNFCQDWSYDEWDGEARTLSAPINGHADMRQRLFRSRFGETEEEIEIKALIRPQFSFDYSSDVSASNTAGYLTVTANEDYTIYCGSSWIQNLNTGGTEGEQTFYFYIEPYTGFTDRSTVIEITYLDYDGDYETVELPLVQRAIVPFFNVYPVHQTVDYTSGTTVFVVNTNVPFNVSENASWLELQGITQAGYQAYNVTFDYSANTGVSRQATVLFTFTVDATGGTQTITPVVRQDSSVLHYIKYTSYNQSAITPNDISVFGATYYDTVYYPEEGYGYWIFRGEPTLIGRRALSNKNTLVSVEMPDSITAIGIEAFNGCTLLSEINIPDSVASIGNYAFSGCRNATSLHLPSGLTTIDYGTFNDCSGLTTVTIPESVTFIRDYAFNGCSNLSSATLSDNVEVIGYAAFSKCSGITSVNVSEKLTRLGGYAFNNTAWYSSQPNGDVYIEDWYYLRKGTSRYSYGVTITEGTVGIADYAFERQTRLTAVTIPDTVKYIGGGSFSGCTNLYYLNIPESVISIGGSAFYGCNSLTSIYIPSGVTYIGGSILASAINVSSITVNSGNTIYNDGNGSNCIIETATNTLITGCYTTVIPNGVTSIGESAFRRCSSLSSITIPDEVIEIGYYAFAYCSNLSSITIGSGVTEIIQEAFAYCSSLSDINYNGTIEQWNAIGKGSSWHYNVPATVVHCTDGDTPI